VPSSSTEAAAATASAHAASKAIERKLLEVELDQLRVVILPRLMDASKIESKSAGL